MGKTAYFFLWLLVLSMPLENMVVLPGFGTVSRIIGVFAVVFCGMAWVMEGEGRNLRSLHLWILGFFLWSTLSYFWTIDEESSLTSIKTIGQIFIFLLILWELAKNQQEIYGLLNAYLLGSSIAIASILKAYLENVQVTYFRYSAAGFDPNDISLTIALGVPIAWFLSLRTQNTLAVWLYRFYLPATFFAVVLTASRGSFLALAFAFSIVLLTMSHLRRLEKILIAALIVCSAVLIVQFAPSYSWERLSTIYGETTSGTLNARSTIWVSGIQVFSERPLLGSGIGTFSPAVEGDLGLPIAPHNVFLSILVGQGVIGLLLFAAIFFQAFFDQFKLLPLERKLWMVLLATWVIGGMTLGWEYRKPTWFLLGIFANFVFCQGREGEVVPASDESRSFHDLEPRNVLRG